MKIRSFQLIVSIIFLAACQNEKLKIQQIDFSTTYKFSSEIEKQLETDTIASKYQRSAGVYAQKADYRNALIHWDSAMGIYERKYSHEEEDSIREKYSVVNAKDYIIEEAQNHKVVIINEAHHNSMHRAFTKSLLSELYEKGYKNLGLEALDIGNNLDSALNSRGYPIQRTGYYTKDPQFGDLVRQALEIGYNVFAYERIGIFFGKQREIDQARNIQKEMESRPDEKFLIHCGFDHAMEGSYPSWGKAMAARLKEYTGIDPSTINQDFYTEKSNAKFNDPLLKAIVTEESAVLIDKTSKTPLRYERGEAWTDVAILHPNTQYLDGRPDWLFENGNKNVSVDLNDIPIEFPVMVLAYKKGEDINAAVPIDIVEVEKSTEKCHLALKRGDYEIVVTNKTESYKFEREVK
ncbi:hypothetical protein SAMN05661096_03930 [Marivirga sericea]|uniref:Erythromycin esterase n=1 Tax=Marivirga sericea TaxID=1028 RepID=A0A1X7LF38_9BACT|nr:hypothetical protein [Marivirga sericea]SMG52458.1 hypothetical protein SAMN05661096_03930 [Marivirga sericea]